VPLADADILGVPRGLLTLAAAMPRSASSTSMRPSRTASASIWSARTARWSNPQWVFERIEHAEPSDLASESARPGGGPLSPGDTVLLSDLFDPAELSPGTEFGLFLVADGWAEPRAIFDVGTLEFRTGGAAARVTDTTPQLFHIAETASSGWSSATSCTRSMRARPIPCPTP
jgi:hypothetical protein